MASKARGVRETQKGYYEVTIERRRKLLIEKGVDKARIKKDPYLRHLRARLRQTNKGLSTLQALKNQQEALVLRKKQKLEAKTAEPPSGSPEENKKAPKKAKKKEPS